MPKALALRIGGVIRVYSVLCGDRYFKLIVLIPPASASLMSLPVTPDGFKVVPLMTGLTSRYYVVALVLN